MPRQLCKIFCPGGPALQDGYLLLAEIYLQQGERSQAEAVLRQALQVESLSPRDRARVAAALQKLADLEPPKGNNRDKR